MFTPWDADEWEVVTEHRSCTACGGNLRCNGMCNGMSSFGYKRRDPVEVKRIGAERERQRADAILQEADFIIAQRRRGSPAGKSLDEISEHAGEP